MAYLSEDSLYPKLNCAGMLFLEKGETATITPIPCWSVGALLEVMPEQITYSDFKPFPLGLFKGDKDTHSKYGHYWIQYFDPEHGGAYVQTNGYSPLEAAYNMVVWLLENNYIKQ